MMKPWEIVKFYKTYPNAVPKDEHHLLRSDQKLIDYKPFLEASKDLEPELQSEPSIRDVVFAYYSFHMPVDAAREYTEAYLDQINQIESELTGSWY